MDTPRGINYERLKDFLGDKAAEANPERPLRTVFMSDLVKVGGLYRIRDEYEPIWRMEADSEGRRYIIRADSDTETPERLRVAEDDSTENYAKAAGTVAAKTTMECATDGCGECRDNVQKAHSPTLPSSKKTKLHEPATHKATRKTAVDTPFAGSWADEEGKKDPKRLPKTKSHPTHEEEDKLIKQRHDKAAYRVMRAGAVYVAWECTDCATSNLTKFGNAAFECDQCHKRYAQDAVLQSDEQPTKNIYTRAEVEEANPAFAKRMGQLGINKVHRSLLTAWTREAVGTMGCKKCKKTLPPNTKSCPDCGGQTDPLIRSASSKCHNCGRSMDGDYCFDCGTKSGSRHVAGEWCVRCDGTGKLYSPKTKSDSVDCTKCGGSGKNESKSAAAKGVKCKDCGVSNPKFKSPCSATGDLHVTKTVTRTTED